ASCCCRSLAVFANEMCILVCLSYVEIEEAKDEDEDEGEDEDEEEEKKKKRRKEETTSKKEKGAYPDRDIAKPLTASGMIILVMDMLNKRLGNVTGSRCGKTQYGSYYWKVLKHPPSIWTSGQRRDSGSEGDSGNTGQKEDETKDGKDRTADSDGRQRICSSKEGS
ncbi:hypothetical protein TRV_02798, partial [Trichophyton verrucosum HKI 0517]